MSQFIYVEPEQPVGYCRYHSWLLDPVQLRERGCLVRSYKGGECLHFIGFKEDEFWSKRHLVSRAKDNHRYAVMRRAELKRMQQQKKRRRKR